MSPGKRWWIAGVAVLLLSAGAAFILSRAPATSSVVATHCLITSDNTCLRFPTVSGSNLLDEAFVLPADFEGDYGLVIMPFDEGQQMRAESWLAPAQEWAAQYPGLTYYNTAIFTDINPAVRLFIRGGMIVAIPDSALRRLTITLFLEDREAFLTALAIPDIEDMQIFLLKAGGEILWRGRGAYSPAQGTALDAVLHNLYAAG